MLDPTFNNSQFQLKLLRLDVINEGANLVEE